MLCFKPTTWKYMGCIHIKIAIYIAAFLMIVTQLYVSIYYLTYHQWFAFIPLFAVPIAMAVLYFGHRKQKRPFIMMVLIYQIAATLCMLGVSIWMLVVLCQPGDNFVFAKCAEHYHLYDAKEHCKKQSRITGSVYFGVFLALFGVNVVCSDILLKFFGYLRLHASTQSHRSYPSPNMATISYQRSAPAATRAATHASPPIAPPTVPQTRFERPAAPRVSPQAPPFDPINAWEAGNPYSPGNPYQPTPIEQPIAAPQPAYNPTYPTVRGAGPAYSDRPAIIPNTNLYDVPPVSPHQHLYDAPPPYESNIGKQ